MNSIKKVNEILAFINKRSRNHYKLTTTHCMLGEELHRVHPNEYTITVGDHKILPPIKNRRWTSLSFVRVGNLLRELEAIKAYIEEEENGLEMVPEIIKLTEAMGIEAPHEETVTFRFFAVKHEEVFAVKHEEAKRTLLFVKGLGGWEMKSLRARTLLSFVAGGRIFPSYVEFSDYSARVYYWYPHGDGWDSISYYLDDYLELKRLFKDLPWIEGSPPPQELRYARPEGWKK